MSQLVLRDEHFGLCRICLEDPDARNVPFVHVMTPVDGELKSKEQMLDLLGITIEDNDDTPQMICKFCAVSLETWDSMKKKAIESNIVINYIASKKFGITPTSSVMLRNNVESSQGLPFNHSRLPSTRSNRLISSMPGTSIASTSSSLMVRNNVESSQGLPFNYSRLPSTRSNRLISSMPGTSIASTSSLMVRNNIESSQGLPFNYSRLPSTRSNRLIPSMPGTSIASTSSMMLQNNEESSQEPPFNHSRLPSTRSNRLISSMPGTSIASTSSMMVRNNVVSSQEPPLNHSRLPSTRSNRLISSMPGTSIASTSSMMVRNNVVSSQEPPLNHSRSLLKRSNKFGVSMPGTSTASTSSLMLQNNEESSQEPLFKYSRLSSTRSNKLSSSMPGTSTASTSSLMSRNNEKSSQKSLSKHSQSISKKSNNNGTNLVGCGSSNKQGNHSRSLISNSSLDDDSDDGSCIIVTTPIETIEVTDDEDTNDDNDNIENEIINVDEPYYEETVESSHDEEAIELSSDSEDSDNILQNETFNNVAEKLYYCSICQKKNTLNHDCSQHTKSFFTCLVPCCNILSRSQKDFISHYQPHIGMPLAEFLCHRCFKGIDQSNIDGKGCHIRCDTANVFKCYSCNVRFDSMQEFAFHKLKTHNGILMDANCNYLCLYCEESSPDVLEITEHIKHCIENQAKKLTAARMKLKKPAKNVTAARLKLKKPAKNETKLLPVKTNTIKNVMIRTNKNNKTVPRTSQHVLFTCLKSSCNKIFSSFSNFKYHYRRHFELGNTLVCWQCCKPFFSSSDLRAHQVKNDCRTPGLYKCFKCSSKFNDLESLSIHKLTFHDGKLIAGKKNRKTIICEFCQMNINIFEFKSHLITCQNKGDKKKTCTTKDKGSYTCLTCEREFPSSISLSNHSRIHNPSRMNSNVKKRISI